MKVESDDKHKDSVGEFVQACLTITLGAVTTGVELYRSYEAWCEKHSYVPVGPVRFGCRLREFGVRKARNARQVIYLGAMILPVEPQASPR